MSDENTLPYERPPLLKSFLAGEKTTPDILINKPAFYSDHGIEVFLNTTEFWGDPTGATEIVYRGEVENGRFSVWWLNEDDQVLAAFIMDCPEEERKLAPEWIRSGKKLSPHWLQEAEFLHPKQQIKEPLGELN